MIDVVKNLILLFLRLEAKERGKPKEIAINGSPKVTAPEDKRAVSSMIGLNKERREGRGEASRDREVHYL